MKVPPKRVYPPPPLPNCRECLCLAACLTQLNDPIQYMQIRPLTSRCSLIGDYITVEVKITRREMNGGDYTRQEISFMRIDDLVEMFEQIRSEIKEKEHARI